jgi:uncharacterized cupredoxin-like copper-binding protein
LPGWLAAADAAMAPPFDQGTRAPGDVAWPPRRLLLTKGVGTMRMLRCSVCLAALLGLVGLVGCGSDSSEGDAGTVPATLKDFSIKLDKSSVPAGTVKFEIDNDGPSTHEFVVFKTDLAPDALPKSDDEDSVDEEGEGVEHVDEVEDIDKGDSKTLEVDLDAGHYVVICNLPSHYGQGMHAELDVG